MTGRSFTTGRCLRWVGGNQWWLDARELIDGAILTGAWEPATTAVVRKIVGPGQVALDVGANIGWYTVILSRLVGPSGRVVAFEPMPEPATLTRTHIQLNGLSNATLQEVALDDHDHEEDNVLFNYSWAVDKTDLVAQPKARIRFRLLDDLATEIGLSHVDFIKIDVDGYEARMLRGAEGILRRDRPTLLLEVCDYTLQTTAGRLPARRGLSPEYGTETRKMLEHLTGLGYRFQDEVDLHALTIDAILAGPVDLSTSGINAVCTAR